MQFTECLSIGLRMDLAITHPYSIPHTNLKFKSTISVVYITTKNLLPHDLSLKIICIHYLSHDDQL